MNMNLCVTCVTCICTADERLNRRKDCRSYLLVSRSNALKFHSFVFDTSV